MDVDELNDAIGENVRRARQALGFSQEGLADAADLSKGTVVAIEQHRGNPSVATLCALAEALGVGLQSLLERPAGPSVKRRTARDAIELWRTDDGSVAQLLLGTDPPGSVELWRWSIEPGDRFEGAAHPRGTVETLHVEAGRLVVEVGANRAEAAAGDTVAFEAHEPHVYRCDGDEPVRFTMWIRVGDVGSLPLPSPAVGMDDAADASG